MTPAGFEPTIPTSERLQTHALERAATGIGPVVSTAWKTFVHLTETRAGSLSFTACLLLHNPPHRNGV